MSSNKEEHRKMWLWLAKHPDKCKLDYFKLKKKLSIPLYKCFACSEAYERYLLSKGNAAPTKTMCEYCPMCNGVKEQRHCLNGLYRRWVYAEGNNKLRTELALRIANLEWKEK